MREPRRPEIHFTAHYGWTNDPNGLFWRDGVWHMFFQHNPTGLDWGNIYWGHAVSRDLIHWEELTDPEAQVHTVEGGIVASGGAFVDTEGRAGLGEGAALLYYTLYPPCPDGRSFDGHGFTQNLAVVPGGSDRVHYYEGNPIVGNQGQGNRDPVVTWCEELGCYLMIIFLQDGTSRFLVLRSEDLLHWDVLQEISLPGDEECPALVPFTADDGSRRWVLTAAHGTYVTGHMSPEGFRAEGEVQTLVQGKRYAAQWFANAPGGRHVHVAWNTLYVTHPAFSQQMSFPTETTLVHTPAGYRLREWPVEEIRQIYGQCIRCSLDLKEGPEDAALPGVPLDLFIAFSEKTPRQAELTLYGLLISWDLEQGTCRVGDLIHPLPEGEWHQIRLLLDWCSAEVFWGKGELVTTLMHLPDLNQASLRIRADDGARRRAQVTAWELVTRQVRADG